MKEKFSLPLPLAVVLLFVIVVGSIFLATHIAESATAQHLVQQFGYGGIVVLAFITGFNLLVPVPIGVFVPIFIASGLSSFGILFSMIVGTIIADLVGFAIGATGKHYVDPQHNRWYQRMVRLKEQHRKLILPFVAAYAAFVPYPNELIVIPLAFLGIRLWVLLIPLVIGTIIHQSLFFFGIQAVLQFVGID